MYDFFHTQIGFLDFLGVSNPVGHHPNYSRASGRTVMARAFYIHLCQTPCNPCRNLIRTGPGPDTHMYKISNLQRNIISFFGETNVTKTNRIFFSFSPQSGLTNGLRKCHHRDDMGTVMMLKKKKCRKDEIKSRQTTRSLKRSSKLAAFSWLENSSQPPASHSQRREV